MSVDTDGQICFGVMLEEGTQVPWEDAEELIEWWRKVNNYVPPYEPFNAEGAFNPGWTYEDSRFDDYYEDREIWDEANPVPVEVVNYCSYDYPMYIVAIPGTLLTASRGYPLPFSLESLQVTQEDIDKLLGFLGLHNIEYVGAAGWILSSFYGV